MFRIAAFTKPGGQWIQKHVIVTLGYIKREKYFFFFFLDKSFIEYTC